jgi:hypothetical protein
MSPMQKRLFHGRTLACQRCAKPFTVTEETPEPAPARAVRRWQREEDDGPGAPSTSSPAATSPAPAAGPGMPAPQPRRPAASGQGMTAGRTALLIALIMVVLSLGLYFAMGPSVHRAREAGRRATCAGNLQQIGMALQSYTAANGGLFPDSLEPLVLDGTIPAGMLVCPSSHDTAAPGATFAEQVANLASGEHQSYVYVGKGLTTLTPGRQLVAYEPLEHHDGQGVTALYSDFSVQFLPAAVATTAIPQIAPGAAPASRPAGPAGTGQPRQ